MESQRNTVLWLKRLTLVNQDEPYYYSYYALYASSFYEIHVENCQIICTNGNCNSDYYSSSVIKVSFGYEGVCGNCHITNCFIKSDCFGCLFEDENGSLEFNHNVVECENYLSLYANYVTNLTFTENYFNKSLDISYGNGSLKLNSNIIYGKYGCVIRFN